MKAMNRKACSRARVRGGHHILLAAFILFVLASLAGAQAPSAPMAPDKRPARPAGSAEERLGLQLKPLDFKPPQVSHATLASGITLDYYAEPTIPLVTVMVRLRVGTVNDPPGKVGAAEMTGDVIRTGGTAHLSGDQLDRQIESRGAQISVETGREQTWFRLSVLKEDLPWAMRLMTELLTQPAFPPDRLEEIRARSIVALRQRLDVPQNVAQELFPQLVYGKGNPWGWTATERTVKAITVDDLRELFKKYYVTGNMKLGLCGDVSWDDARRLAEETFGRLPRQPAPALDLPDVAPIEKPQVYIVPREVTQNVVYLGHEGIGRFDPFKFPIKVFNSVLSSGFTSRLVKEIRSDRGLAYEVFGMVSEGTKKGIFENVALTKVESTGQVLTLFEQIEGDLTRQPPTPEEVALAKQSDINAFVFFFDTPEKIVQQKIVLDAFGYPPDYLATYTDKLKAVTPEQVKAAAQARLHPARSVILVVGTVDATLREQLAKLGPITEISEDELRSKWL